MSKRFTVTVPDAIGQVVERAAEAEGAKAATTASFMLETAIREGLQNGTYPKEWAVLEKSKVSEESMISPDQSDHNVLVNLVSQLAEGSDPSPTAIAQAARVAKVSPHALHAALEKRKNGNGEPARQ